MTKNASLGLTLAVAVLMFSSPVLAQSTNNGPSDESGATTDHTRSGYTSSSGLEMGDSVTEDIEQDDIKVGSAFRFPGEPLKPWFDMKRKWNKNYGLKLNFSYQSLHQNASESPEEDKAAAGRLELNGSWTLIVFTMRRLKTSVHPYLGNHRSPKGHFGDGTTGRSEDRPQIDIALLLGLEQ